MTSLLDASFTVSEAAFVAGLSERAVHHEIDQKVIRPSIIKGTRRLSGIDLLYLGAVKPLRTMMRTPLRKQVRKAIAEAAGTIERSAKISNFTVVLDRIENDLREPLRQLDHMRKDQIESHADVLAGEPVLKGTRIAARYVAELMRQGATRDELAVELDLDANQIEAALIFDRVSPKRGRPVVKKRAPHAPSHR